MIQTVLILVSLAELQVYSHSLFFNLYTHSNHFTLNYSYSNQFKNHTTNQTPSNQALSSRPANDTICYSKIIILSNVKICVHIQEDLAKNLVPIVQLQPAWCTT
eukprot:381739_1